MSTILEQICSNTYTVIDVHRRLGLLQECVEEVLYKKDESTHTNAAALSVDVITYAHTVGLPEDVEAFTQWNNEVWDSFQTNNIADRITKIKQESETLPTLTLYVPVAFDTTAVQVVGVWARSALNNRILLEIHIDPHVVGGCAFVFNDTYHDFSLHHSLSLQKGIVTKLLTSYV